MPEDRLLDVVVDALDELKAFDVTVLDVRELTEVADHMVVASGRSARQVSAIADNVAQRAKASGQRALGIEGRDTGEWVLVDLCDVIVHVMQPKVREFYQLERLWGGTERRSSSSDGGSPRSAT